MTSHKRLVFSILLVILLVIQTAFLRYKKASSDCDKLQVKISVGTNNRVDVQITGLQGKQTLYLIGSKGFAKENISVEDLNKLGKGSYLLVVIDQKGSDHYCQKHFDFTIK